MEAVSPRLPSASSPFPSAPPARWAALAVALLLAPLAAPAAAAPVPDPLAVGPSPAPAAVSAGALAALDALVADMAARWGALDAACDPDAVFALTYLLMTEGIREHVAAAYFDDGDHLAALTLLFAGRYTEAFDAWARGARAEVSAPWAEAFAWGESGQSTVLEDVMLGMNAHISYDLPIAAWQLGYADLARKADYDRVNDVLAAVAPRVNAALGAHYDPLFQPTPASPLTDAAFAEAVAQWRTASWGNAALLTAEPPPAQGPHLDTMETAAGLVAKAFQVPKPSTEAGRRAYCEANP